MQYIECIHCKKRYPATRKHRDAMGKKVRCPNCGKSFPIIVYDPKPAQGQAADSEAGDPTSSGAGQSGTF